MQYIKLKEIDNEQITRFFVEHWDSPEMVISSGVYQCDRLPGYAAVSSQRVIVGLITYIINAGECEIISLDSLLEKQGIGTKLVGLVEMEARNTDCHRLKLVTTNDNMHALGFYQRRGYRIVKIFSGAVDKARAIKPEIPLVAENGIAIKDELLLAKRL
ncbi:GNAT family N-acetyltransferase [Sediminibacillus albus]|uniref:Acetyltransferase (GNAT) family protein n=1 Tax=Sediminibacillus albus TaxID=407036 RepID=A0A1G8VI22_9BACI|nr:GNAT family N-acetyltransferase [Sediminibacillus albus]SDJ65564.1 Acetyltransferase (GNAT) family protein [Sediminibacillus albus]